MAHLGSSRSPTTSPAAPPTPAPVQSLAHLSRETQEAGYGSIMTGTQFMMKERHQPIAIFIGIIILVVLMIGLYFFTKWRFGKIVDENVPKDAQTVDPNSANSSLKSALSGMDGLQMALLAGAAAVAIGCAYAYLLAQKRSELEKGFGLHVQLTQQAQQPTGITHEKVGVYGGM